GETLFEGPLRAHEVADAVEPNQASLVGALRPVFGCELGGTSVRRESARHTPEFPFVAAGDEAIEIAEGTFGARACEGERRQEHVARFGGAAPVALEATELRERHHTLVAFRDFDPFLRRVVGSGIATLDLERQQALQRSAVVRVALEDGVEQSAYVRLSSEVLAVNSSERDFEADAILAIGGERGGPLELLSGRRKLTIAQVELTERNDSAQMIGHELLDA